MDKVERISEDWYLIFTGSKLEHWLMPFLQPSFKHCLMVREDAGLWQIVSRAHCYLNVETKFVDDYPHIRQLYPNAVILPVTTSIDPDKPQYHLGINSCVDVCKGLLGISAFWIFTPWQLYKHVKRMG